MTKIINKAAEEGGRGLPPLPEMNLIVTEKPGVRFESRGYTNKQMHDYAREAIAADRAARPVANKAEVEKAAAWIDQFGNVWPLGAYSPTGKPNYLDADKRGWKPLFRATPPATTGASTARVIAWAHEDGRVVAASTMESAQRDGGAMKSSLAGYTTPLGAIGMHCPASTVLTDERIDAIWGSTPGIGHKSHRYDFAREVAAQAGQVAVPEGYVLMPKRLTAENGAKSLLLGEFKETIQMPCPECDGEGDDECLTCENMGEVPYDIPVNWENIKAIYEMAVEHLAAPSPASESLRSPQEAAGTEKGAQS